MRCYCFWLARTFSVLCVPLSSPHPSSLDIDMASTGEATASNQTPNKLQWIIMKQNESDFFSLALPDGLWVRIEWLRLQRPALCLPDRRKRVVIKLLKDWLFLSSILTAALLLLLPTLLMQPAAERSSPYRHLWVTYQQCNNADCCCRPKRE